MRKAIWIPVSVGFGCLFWAAIDATGIEHEPWNPFDRRSLCGLAAWVCVVLSVGAAKRAFPSSAATQSIGGEG